MSDTNQATPLEHSSLIGGSTASRRINCPMSYHLEQIVPKSKGSSYAREGTALHELIAQILDTDAAPEDLLPYVHNQPPKGVEEAWSLTVGGSLWDELGQPALDMFDAFADRLEAVYDAPFTFYVEKSFEFPGVPGGFGTSDIVFRCGPVGGIWDWKFGRGPVPAEENSQLKFYFASARAGMPKFFKGIEEVFLCISQPKVNDEEPDVWECEPSVIDEFEETVLRAIETIKTTDRKTAPCEKGSWCAFADCKVACPEHRGAAVSLGEKMAQIKDFKEEKIDVDIAALLSDALELAEMAKEWSAAVIGMAHERLDHGLEIVGWKTVDKRSSGRVWTVDDDVVEKRLASRGLKVAEYRETKPISVAQAEKKLKKLGKELPEDIYEKKASSGTTLVRDGDPRAETRSPAKAAKALGSALAKHLNEED